MVKAHIRNLLLGITILFTVLDTKAQNDEDGLSVNEQLNIQAETNAKVKLTSNDEINCENFNEYALNCTMNSALMYNSYRKSPPMPAKLHDWCRAVKYLTKCASDWNNECRPVTDSHFNEDSIYGHSYVVTHVCNDVVFMEKYMELSDCVEHASDHWEVCYTSFKGLVDSFKKNTTVDWTHYETHFYMCCGRALFRRCVLDVVFNMPTHCNHEQAITLQKYSVIISEGDVYQNCDFNMMYSNCPGGDPRPPYNNLNLEEVAELGKKKEEPLAIDETMFINETIMVSPDCALLLFMLTILCHFIL